MLYVIRDREAGNVIDTFMSKERAEAELIKYESDDKKDGTYTEDFYEIIEVDNVSYIVYIRNTEVKVPHRDREEVMNMTTDELFAKAWAKMERAANFSHDEIIRCETEAEAYSVFERECNKRLSHYYESSQLVIVCDIEIERVERDLDGDILDGEIIRSYVCEVN